MSEAGSLRTTQADISPGMIDLAIGHPSPSLLPVDLIRRAAGERLAGDFTPYLQYGYEPGDGYFRQELASFLKRRYQVPVSAEQLFVSGGVSQALDLLCTVYTKPGDLVFVEEPTYFLALRIFADHGLKAVALPTDEHGLVVEALAEALKTRRPAFLYTIPTYQNPSGATLPRERRRRIVELSHERGFLIVADEVYHLLSYGDPPPPPLSAFVEEETVVSLGSFSKILAPGLRLGWIHAAWKLLQPLAECGFLDSGGGVNPFTSAVVRGALEAGMQDEHLQRLHEEYGRRLRTLNEVLERRMGDRVYFERPSGGFFFWLRLRDGRNAGVLLDAAVRHKTRFVPGSAFSAGDGMNDRLRLSFSYHPPETLVEGVERLAQSLASL